MRLIYSLIFIILSVTLAPGQSRLSLKSLDLDQLTTALTTNLNEVRDTLGAPRFRVHNSLQKAAANHSGYCLKTASTKHHQPSKKLKTPQNRAKHFGSEHAEVAEVAVHLDLSKMGVNTYQDIANLLLRVALKTPTNRQNLSNKQYQYIGQSVRFESGQLYCVWVLGSPVVFTKALTTPPHLYGLSSASPKNQSTTQAFNALIKEMPQEVSFDVHVQNDSIYFLMSELEWFQRLFAHKNDGFAVDIVLKDQFACGIANVESPNPNYTGYLMPPVFSKSFDQLATVTSQGIVRVPAGRIPAEWKDKSYEINLMLIHKGVISRYNAFFRIPFGPWQTLDLEFERPLASVTQKKIDVLHKQMHFVVPFEKGKSTFEASDLKPLADSMSLTDYQIKRVRIKAFASVEGNKKTNLTLQQNRAQSIVEALEVWNLQDFVTEIYTAENWVDFFGDIKQTKWAFLGDKTQDHIRQYLNTHQLEDLDQLLNAHRKATIQIDLERRAESPSITKGYIRELAAQPSLAVPAQFEVIEQLMQMNIAAPERLGLLDYLLAQTKDHLDWSAEAIGRIALEIYELDATRLPDSKNTLDQLALKNPNSSMLGYNSFVFGLLLCEAKGQAASDLLQTKISSSTLLADHQKARLLLNVSILETAQLWRTQQYEAKDATLREAYQMAKKTDLSEKEVFVVAKYLASYQKYQEAIRLLKPYVQKLNALEDLLFLYINLTLIDDQMVKQPHYRTMLTNASLANPDRFCRLFESSFDGGITFQLLRNKYLKRAYCEQCH